MEVTKKLAEFVHDTKLDDLPAEAIEKGHPENPLSTRELEKKFRNAAKMTITENNIEMLIEKIKSIEHVADIREIVDLLH
ncbi:MAG: hypothetical protein JRI72_01025 [Deltaproteobacteria bacterium]|nr:hypothetical protein [Deltaproteobacteria bacterium]